MPSVPVGRSGLQAILDVRAYADEPSEPSDAQILRFLNIGVEEVTTKTGGIRLWGQYATVANQATVSLDDDVLDVVSANFSSASAGQYATPISQGALVYPMEQMEQKMFMDSAAGFPVVGFGPPQAYFVYQDEGQAPTNTVPAPPEPQLSSVSGTSNGLIVEVVLTLVNPNGETTQSEEASFTPATTEQVSVGFPPRYTNAQSYNIYAGAVGGPYYLQNTTGAIAIGTTYTIPGTPLSSGTQPPSTNTATGSGQGGALTMQLYPACMIGQVNIYYRARPLLWADATATSYTNLDTSAQEAVVLFATKRVMNIRGRGEEFKAIWQPDYDALIESLKESLGRRINTKSGQVRDVANRSYPNAPYWLR